MTRLVSLIAVCMVGTGCVAKDDGSLGKSDSKSAGDALGNGIEDSAASFGPVNAGATADAACTTLTGDTTDTDADSIPANATLTFDCTAMALGYTGTLTGTETVMDSQPAAVAWAFAATADLHASLTAPLGGSIVRDWSGTITATQASLVGPFALDRTLDAVTVFTPRSLPATTVTEANAWTVTYTPQATWTPGGVVVTGSLTATGTWDVTVGNRAAHATLATPTALTLSPSCATRVTAGTITGTYESTLTHTISVTWTACGQRTVTYTEQ
jgi:hypothetical protein